MSTESKIWTFDQLLRQRAIDEDQTPIIAFPRSRHGTTDYDRISGSVLDQFVDGAARQLARRGFPPVSDEVVVGICAPTDLDYLINIFALVRLGYTVFQLSPRLAASAIKELLFAIQEGRHALLYCPEYKTLKPSALDGLELHQMVTREEFEAPQDGDASELQRPNIDYEKEHTRRCLILHSSGSTGLPKPIDYNHQKVLMAGVYAQNATAFISMPFSHALCMMSYMQAIYARRTMYAISGYVPQTHDTLTAAITEAKPEIMWTVPYVLKLLAEKQDGIDAIKNCRFVSSGGSRLPDELGDLLTDAGVHVGSQFGSTETGLILSSAYRPREDKAWNYLRPPPHVVPYIVFKPVDPERFECLILDGHKGKTMSNCDDPPNSWRTSDLFVPHATIANAWKFVGRMDDRITLINGEKVLPLTIEGRIRHHPLVKEAVVFGIDRDVPGLLLFRALGTSNLSDNEYIEQVWPVVEIANSYAEAFSQISREMIAVMPEDVECPLTDKSSIKRGVIYKEFASTIDAVYKAAGSANKKQCLTMNIDELQSWVVEQVRAQGCEVEDPTQDFFAAGMDSLKAIHLRSTILRNVDLGGHDSDLSSTTVFDCGNAKKLAERLYAIRTGNKTGDSTAHDTMNALIEKYSSFPESKSASTHVSAKPSMDGGIVILTGATGFLGAHILTALVESRTVRKIFAFMRPGSNAEQTALDRLDSSLRAKGFDIPLIKVVPLYNDVAQNNFGLDAALFNSMKSQVTHIIHCAWTVNFAINLAAFESQILGLHNLLSFSMQTDRNAQVLFCSSIGTAQATKCPARIASAPIPSFDNCSAMGYSQSKLVGERITEVAVKAGANATVLRIGQIIPGRRRGVKLWNPSEAMPLMVRSASSTSVGALPLMDAARDACDWIEADTLADSILQIAGIGQEIANRSLVYNLVNPHAFSWQHDFLPALKRAGLIFDIVTWEEWITRLEASSDDARANPSKKLLGFWQKQTPREGELVFETDAAEADSSAFRAACRLTDGDLLGQVVSAWTEHAERDTY